MEDVKPVDPSQRSTKKHLKKHKKKYMASGIVIALVAAALELLPGLQELAKLKIEQAINELREVTDAGR